MKSAVYSFIILLAVSVFAAEMVELKPEYPKPRAKGTEVPKTPNLEASRKKGTAPALIKIPKGCKNVAAEKFVSSSDEDPIEGDLDMITDEDAEASEFVQLKEGLQWVQIDLEKSYELHAVHMWHYHQQPRVYYDVIIQVSDDEDFIKGVTTVFNNDHDNSAGMGRGTDKNYIEEYYGKSIKINAVKGRYVRFYSKGSTGDKSNHYIEIQVYGK